MCGCVMVVLVVACVLDNDMGAGGATQLAPALMKMSHLTSLDLGGALAWCAGCGRCGNHGERNADGGVAGNFVDVQGVQALARALVKTPRMAYLNLQCAPGPFCPVCQYGW